MYSSKCLRQFIYPASASDFLVSILSATQVPVSLICLLFTGLAPFIHLLTCQLDTACCSHADQADTPAWQLACLASLAATKRPPTVLQSDNVQSCAFSPTRTGFSMQTCKATGDCCTTAFVSWTLAEGTVTCTGAHLDGEVQRVQELEVGGLLAGRHYRFRQIHCALAPSGVMPAYHSIKGACT